MQAALDHLRAQGEIVNVKISHASHHFATDTSICSVIFLHAGSLGDERASAAIKRGMEEENIA